MNLRRLQPVLFLLLAPFSLLQGGDAAAPASPAINWVLPIFSDKEGYRILRATGSRALPPAADGTVQVTNLNVTVYAGDASNRIESIFLSPQATFSTRDNRASGNRTVRLLRDDLEATSTTWSYDQERKHVTLTGNVRIVFNAELKDLLK